MFGEKVDRNFRVIHENVPMLEALSEGSKGIITLSSNVNWRKCKSKIIHITSNFLQNTVKLGFFPLTVLNTPV